MATVIQQPASPRNETSGAGVIIGVALAILLILAFFLYLLPTLRSGPPPADRLDVNIEERLTPSPSPSPSPSPTPTPQVIPQSMVPSVQ